MALVRESHWIWWIAGVGPVVFVLLGIGWLIYYVWLPRVARTKLAHLPNRQVRVEASDETLSFQTATERLEVAWAELKALKRRPNFWLVGLRSGARIPIPAELLDKDAISFLEARLAEVGRVEPKGG